MKDAIQSIYQKLVPMFFLDAIYELNKISFNYKDSKENGRSVSVSIHLNTSLSKDEIEEFISEIFENFHYGVKTCFSFDPVFVEEGMPFLDEENCEKKMNPSYYHLYFSIDLD